MNYKPVKGTIDFFKTDKTYIKNGCFKVCYKKGFFNRHIEFPTDLIKSVEQVSAESINTGAALGYGVIGGVLTGGIGLALGAGLGAFNKKAYFRVLVDASNRDIDLISELADYFNDLPEQLIFIVEAPIKGMQKHLVSFLMEV